MACDQRVAPSGSSTLTSSCALAPLHDFTTLATNTPPSGSAAICAISAPSIDLSHRTPVAAEAVTSPSPAPSPDRASEPAPHEPPRHAQANATMGALVCAMEETIDGDATRGNFY